MSGIILALTIGFLLGVLLMVILIAGRDESQSAERMAHGANPKPKTQSAERMAENAKRKAHSA